MWKSNNSSHTPHSASDQFAFECFTPARIPDRKSLTGEWTGKTWSGSFRLIDGVSRYALTFDGETWRVQRDDAA